MERKSVDNLSIGILARNSLSSSSRRASQISLLAESSSENYQHIDDRNWSWSFLRNSFRIGDLGELYDRYVRRLQNAYFNVYLLLQISLSLAYIGILCYFSFTFEEDANSPNGFIDCNNDTNYTDESALDLAFPEILAHGILAVFCLLQMFIVWNEKAFRADPRVQIVLAVLTAVVLVGTDLGTSYYFHSYYGCVRITSGFQSLIIVYFFLPLPRKFQAIILGIIVTVVHMAFSTVIYKNEIFPRIMSDFVYYLCANVVGTYSQLLSEVTIRRAFMDRRGYIKSTIKKKYEKEQEEQLLLSILPRHISVKVKNELLNALQHLKIEEPQHHNPHNNHNNHRSHRTSPDSGNNHGAMHRKPFSDLFVEKHHDVTILYADIVNFTPLTVKLKADELVDTLNELFGRFDEAASHYNCLRIKLLGDCYYCVSGLPNPTPDHAKNCIQLGFEMIEIIKDVRETLKVDVAMRIGVHSGNILSGLLGIYKWQYDIWSKDVTIANHMEQAGKPGRIHITKQTKDILGDAYMYDSGYGRLRDKYLADNNVETFFIAVNRPMSQATIEEEDEEGDSVDKNSPIKMSYQSRNLPGPGSSSLSTRRNSVAADISRKKSIKLNPDRRNYRDVEDVQNFRVMMAKVNEQMEKAIDDMPLRKTDQWCRRKSQQPAATTTAEGVKVQNVNPYFMNFESFSAEVQFQTQPDPLFKFYIGCSLFVLLCIGIIQTISVPSDHLVIWLSFGGGMSFLLLLIPFVWVSYIWSRIKDPHRELDAIPEPENRLIKFFYGWSNSISNSWTLRTTLYVIISLLICAFAIIDVTECEFDPEARHSGECQNPWFFTYSCALAILVIYAFFRIHFLLKLFVSMLSLTFYGATVFQFRDYVFSHKEGVSPALSAVGAEMYSHLIYLAWITSLLHVMDRQMEYINRLDFIWKRKLTEEHKEASLTHAINTILIHNILPMQIAKIYLDPNKSREGHNRSYQNVSVMFASIPNFMDFYTENDLNDEGIKCLQLLNEIIVEFDQVLFDHNDVEKIKVIGSTYMAACGLEVHDSGRLSATSSNYTDPDYTPSFRDHSQNNATENLQIRRRTLMTLIKFSVDMMIRLHAINKDAFQEFQLRVGLATGPVVAGVIGVKKPLYDIWGDAVNLSSRMDSTGIPGRIQLSEESALLVKQAGVKCECRGVIRVKGKGDIKTYFVELGQNFKILYDYEDNTVGSTDL